MAVEKSRLEAFSDGVFATVITLSVLDIRFPDVDYSQFKTTLVSLLPRILAYVMSFIIIGVYWVTHHNSISGRRASEKWGIHLLSGAGMSLGKRRLEFYAGISTGGKEKLVNT